MIYYVSAAALRPGDGSEARLFQTIQEAADIAQSGDEILVAPGVYREHVNPVCGGGDADHHHCTRGLWLDWQAQGTRVTGNLFHDNVPPVGTEIGDGMGEDLFVEVSHGPTLMDHNLFLSPCACHLSTQGLAFVHNLIAGSFTFVGIGTDNGTKRFPSPRYTPYHVPHSTALAGFMTILHGDARFYNNLFVQKPIREDLAAYAKDTGWAGLDKLHFRCGTKPYDGYPTAAQYFGRFTAESAVDGEIRDMYYDHLPVWSGGNAYFNGAQPWDGERDAGVDTTHAVMLELAAEGDRWTLRTNLYEVLPARQLPVITTEFLGEAFEPEQGFTQPDGAPIVFDRDYFGSCHGESPLCGPFAEGAVEFRL